MKPTAVVLLACTVVAGFASLSAQTPSASSTPEVFEPLPTLDASVILQPQYLSGPNFTVQKPRADLLRLKSIYDRLRLRSISPRMAMPC